MPMFATQCRAFLCFRKWKRTLAGNSLQGEFQEYSDDNIYWPMSGIDKYCEWKLGVNMDKRLKVLHGCSEILVINSLMLAFWGGFVWKCADIALHIQYLTWS